MVELKQDMVGFMPPDGSACKTRWPIVLAALTLGCLGLHGPALADPDVFQQAVNYVFTGSVDVKEGPEITDRDACIVVMRDPRFNRYIRYYLRRFKMDDALYEKEFAGSHVSYELDVKGDDIVVEYLDPNTKAVLQGYRSAQIRLPGDLDQTQKAFGVIFAKYCKPEKPKTLF
jgi:hypothetical protein